VTHLLAAAFKPAVESSPRASATALAALRVLAGLLWLYNVSWKQPPDFGRDSGNGLYGFTRSAVENPVFPPYSWVVEHVVLPNFLAFGWMVLVVETLLAVLLLTGTLVRLAALIGIGQSLAIGLSVAGTPGEWPWAYWMMIGIHVALLFTSAGRIAAVDAVRAEASDRSASSRSSAPRLLLGWGVVTGLTGLIALVLAFGEDPLASVGSQLGGPDLSISVGSYNVVGAVTLLVVAALMCAAATLRRRELALGSAAVAVLAALSLYVQLSRTDVWLGGSNTSAAFLLCAAVVSGATARSLRTSTHS
jgi:asparagine N-glycosylation enzyme membrane subunit Stt3